jgi:phosphate transport system substrate-binding protein
MKLSFKKILGALGLTASLVFAAQAGAVDLTGAGATFPYPIYAKWAEAYKVQTGVGMNYQSIGSGGGIKQILAKTVDFGATDAPMTPDELGKNGLTQFPTVIGGVVPVVNLEEVVGGQLRLSGEVLADIYLGKITKWDDARIAADNPGLKLPAKAITVVHRADGSGTTFIFTTYLAQISPEWKSTIGAEKSVSWKPGQLGGKGNEGVAVYVQRTKGSIGYVEYAYALQNKMDYVQMKNRDGAFVKPDDSSFVAAAANAKWDKSQGFYEILTNQPGKDSWPITAATFVLIHKTQDNVVNGKEVLKFFDWAYTSGSKMAADMDFVPLPEKVQKLVRESWKASVKDASGKALWK